MQTLTIRHTVARVTKVVEKNKTKNASSFRSFPLTDDAVRLFKILLQQEQIYRNHFGKDYIDNDYVFTWEDGHPYSPDYVSHTFHKLLKKYDLPHIRFHDLRDSGHGVPYGQRLHRKVDAVPFQPQYLAAAQTVQRGDIDDRVEALVFDSGQQVAHLRFGVERAGKLRRVRHDDQIGRVCLNQTISLR